MLVPKEIEIAIQSRLEAATRYAHETEKIALWCKKNDIEFDVTLSDEIEERYSQAIGILMNICEAPDPEEKSEEKLYTW